MAVNVMKCEREREGGGGGERVREREREQMSELAERRLRVARRATFFVCDDRPD
jgi:hypothetical protein